MNSLLVFISTNNNILHGFGTHQGKLSRNAAYWEAKVKKLKGAREKYNYVILNWVLKKHITHGKNMVLIMSQLIC